MPSSAPEPDRDAARTESLADAPLSSARLGPSFALGGDRFRVRVALGFLVLAAAPGIAGGAQRMAVSAAVISSAVIAHELGHALCGLLWGRRVSIVLHVLGARTSIEPRLPRGRELTAIAAGPAVSLGLGSALLWLQTCLQTQQTQPWLTAAVWANLAWGGVNLLPVLPFAGGRALLSVVGAKHRASTLLISGALALVMALEGLIVLHNAPLLFVFGAAACASWFGLVKQRRIELEQALGLPAQLAQARDFLSDGSPERARQLATRVGVRALRNVTANAAWETVAWAELELGDADRACATLGRVRPIADVSRYCLAAVYAAKGQVLRAIGLLERARGCNEPNVAAVKLLIDLHVQRGSFDHACSVAGAELLLLDPKDTRRVLQAAFAGEAFVEATRLAGELYAVTRDPADASSHAYGLAHLGQELSRLTRSSVS
jgi:hypothetical protein